MPRFRAVFDDTRLERCIEFWDGDSGTERGDSLLHDAFSISTLVQGPSFVLPEMMLHFSNGSLSAGEN